MIADPWFYACAVPAVLLVGLSKGGFGGATALLGVPLMSLAVPPIQAAAIMLPILMLMDAVSLVAWRGRFDRRALAILLPAAAAGILVGWLLAASVTDSHVRLVVGAVALLFALNHWFGGARAAAPRPHNAWKGGFWGAVSGFTSFVSHAGGPPYAMYMLPLRLEPQVYAGTAAIYFAALNALKVAPYQMLGQFSAANLAASAALAPLAFLATLCGVWLVRRIRPDAFYRIIYGLVALIALKLVWDGLTSML